MNRTWTTYSRCSQRNARAGLTLIEVIAAIVILGVILTSISIARNRFVRQLTVSEQKRKVIAALDTTVSQWIAESAIPINKRGALAGVANCVWRTRALPTRSDNDLLVQIVRVQVIDYSIHPEVMDDSSSDESNSTIDPAIISIDLVTRLPSRVGETGGVR